MDYTQNYSGIPQMTPSLEGILKHVVIDGQMNGLLNSEKYLKSHSPSKG